MKYSTVVLDLDGTLTNSEKRVTDRTRQALFRYMEAGGTVVLASGRPTYGVWPIAKELQLDVYGGYIGILYHSGSAYGGSGIPGSL